MFVMFIQKIMHFEGQWWQNEQETVHFRTLDALQIV